MPKCIEAVTRKFIRVKIVCWYWSIFSQVIQNCMKPYKNIYEKHIRNILNNKTSNDYGYFKVLTLDLSEILATIYKPI